MKTLDLIINFKDRTARKKLLKLAYSIRIDYDSSIHSISSMKVYYEYWTKSDGLVMKVCKYTFIFCFKKVDQEVEFELENVTWTFQNNLLAVKGIESSSLPSNLCFNSSSI